MPALGYAGLANTNRGGGGFGGKEAAPVVLDVVRRGTGRRYYTYLLYRIVPFIVVTEMGRRLFP